MRKIRWLLLTLAVACSSGNKKIPDSTTVADTAASEIMLSQESIELSASAVTSDTSQLTARFDEVSQAKTTDSENWHNVSISTSQYEAGSDVIWYFDESVSPRYFNMTWSAEGREGSTELFIESNTVTCAQEEENETLEIWCSTTGGIRTTWLENDDQVSKELLPADYATTCNSELERYLNILKTFLQENEITQRDENMYTLRIEKVVNYGAEFTESVEITIPKKVYDALVGH